MTWLASKGGVVQLRPDHKLAITREMSLPERLTWARDTVEALNRISQQAKAA